MLKMTSFSEQVGLEILLLESFDYFGTSEYFSGKKRTILMSKTLWLGVVKLSLNANESCDENAVYFR